MNEIKCPKCGQVFQVDETGYAEILKSVRGEEFERELSAREASIRESAANEAKLADLMRQNEINDLRNQLESQKRESALAAENKLAESERHIERLESELKTKDAQFELVKQSELREMEKRISELEGKLLLADKEHALEKQAMLEGHRKEMALKQEELAHYKDFKAHQSTKMLGESLEQHCEIEFNKMRATAFRNVEFEKDNDARTGSKGDYIYRERAEDGTEIISIMFEMKNEMETTATKKKNEDFFKELDKDRREKGCEYAVLVSMLESESELYNTGIVDVSYRYEKMYVVRPQFFLPIITILRNAAMNALSYKRQLAEVQKQNLDITNFENAMGDFKSKFARDYELASNNFGKAMKEIDDTIKHLEKVKEGLRLTVQHFGHANDKAQDLSIKRLTKNSPMLREAFAELESARETDGE